MEAAIARRIRSMTVARSEVMTGDELLERILALARLHAHGGCNSGAHGLANKILEMAGERPEKKDERTNN